MSLDCGYSCGYSLDMDKTNDIAGYKVTWSHTSQVERCDTYDEAVAIVLAVHPGASIGHDGDIASGGERTLAWSDEASSTDDDGARAVASIWAQHAGGAQA